MSKLNLTPAARESFNQRHSMDEEAKAFMAELFNETQNH